MKHEEDPPSPFSGAPTGAADGGRGVLESSRPSVAAVRRNGGGARRDDVAAAAEPVGRAAPDVAADASSAPAKKKGAGSHPNNVRRLRIDRMLSKAELARRAKLSVLTIDRVEKGYGCRMDTKRKILGALDLGPADRVRVFGDEE